MPSMMITARSKPGREEELQAIQRRLMQDVAANEPGCEVFEVRQVADDPSSFVWFMSFRDEAAFQRYSDAEYHVNAIPKALDCIDGDPVTTQFVDFR